LTPAKDLGVIFFPKLVECRINVIPFDGRSFATEWSWLGAVLAGNFRSNR